MLPPPEPRVGHILTRGGGEGRSERCREQGPCVPALLWDAGVGVPQGHRSPLPGHSATPHGCSAWVRARLTRLGSALLPQFLINREGQVVKRYSPMEDPYVSAAQTVGVWALPAPWHPAYRFQAGHGGLLACSGGSDALAAMLPSFSQVIEKDLPSYL